MGPKKMKIGLSEVGKKAIQAWLTVSIEGGRACESANKPGGRQLSDLDLTTG